MISDPLLPDGNDPGRSRTGAAYDGGHPAATGLVERPAAPPLGPPRTVPGNDEWARPATLAALLQFRWSMLLVFLLTAASTVPWIWAFLSPTYSAKAVVRVSPVVPRIAFKTENNGIIPLYKSYMNTQVSIIRSPTVLQRVLDRKDVGETSWYNHKDPPWLRTVKGPPLSRLERLSEAVSVRPRALTELIDIAVTTIKRKDAEVLANAIVDEYRRFTEESVLEAEILRNETLRAHRTQLQREVSGLMATKFSISESLGTTSPEEIRSQLSTGLKTLEWQLAERKRQAAMTQFELGQVQAESANASPDDPPAPGQSSFGSAVANQPPAMIDDESGDDPTPKYAADTEWRRLNRDLNARRHALDLARQRFGESHPRIAELQADSDYAEGLLRQREEQIATLGEQPGLWAVSPPATPATGPMSIAAPTPGELILQNRASLERQAARLEREIELLTEEIRVQKREVKAAGQTALEIARYEEEITRKKELSDRLRDRLTQLEMESRAPARISIAAHAIAPSRPTRDRRIMMTALALAGAMVLAFGMAYVRLMLDTRICEAGEVRHTVRVPFLGQLPHRPPSVGLVNASNDPITMERVRMVRTALLERLGGQSHHVVLITSATSQEGKSSFSYLLGSSLAQLGKRTLLVEADLRRPSLFAQLNIGSSEGLFALLRGASDDDAVTVSTSVPNLDLITAGDPTETFDPEVLANEHLAACLARWKEAYDFVLLDSPPVLPVADARILAGHADGTIMVLRSAHCRRAEVVQAYADLSAAGGILLGTVLVDAPQPRRATYGAYDYYGTPELASAVIEPGNGRL